MDGSTPGFPVLHHLPELVQTHVHWVSDAIQPSCPQTSPSPALSISQHQGLSQWVSPLHQLAKVLGSSFSTNPSNGYSGLISLRMDWFDLLAVQGDSQESSPTPQFESINSSVFSLLYGQTLTSIHDYAKAMALTIQMFVGKVMSLLFNILSRFCHCFSSKEQTSFNFMAAFTIHSDFGA